MSSRSRGRTVALLLLVAVLVGCGRGDQGSPVAAGGAAGPDAAPGAGPASEPTEPPGPVTPEPEERPVATDRSVPSGTATPGEPVPSVVDGLTSQEVAAAVTAPAGAAARRSAGPSVERLVLASGATVWRVRIPGRFDVRSARVTVTVGSRVIGQGIVAPDLGSLLAVTTDGSGLVAGAAVSYAWEGSEPVPAGSLAVTR